MGMTIVLVVLGVYCVGLFVGFFLGSRRGDKRDPV